MCSLPVGIEFPGHSRGSRAVVTLPGRDGKLDTWIGELRSGSRYEKYEEMYRKWMKKDPPPQRFYDYNKF